MQDFSRDYEKFQVKVEDFERRLGAIACQGFDDASGTEAAFKVVYVLGSLLERPLIAKDFNSRYYRLIEMIDRELDDAKAIYDEYMETVRKDGFAMPHKNLPSLSGALKWSAELLDRITQPMDNLKHIEHEYDSLVDCFCFCFCFCFNYDCGFDLSFHACLDKKYSPLLSSSPAKRLLFHLAKIFNLALAFC